MHSLCERVYKNFVNHVMKKDMHIETPFDVLKSLVYIVEGFNNLTGEEKKAIVIQTIEDITAGSDGILGNNDDLIPLHVLEGLELLIRSNMISATIDLICEATLTKTGITLSCYIYKLLAFIFCTCWCRRIKKKEQEKKKELFKQILATKTKFIKNTIINRKTQSEPNSQFDNDTENIIKNTMQRKYTKSEPNIDITDDMLESDDMFESDIKTPLLPPQIC